MKMTIRKIAEIENDLDAARSEYLREHGWAYRCDLPSSSWFWQKHINGRMVACVTSTALLIEECMSPDEDHRNPFDPS